MILNSMIKDLSQEQFEKSIDINFKGYFILFQKATITLEDNGGIINLSSTVTRNIFRIIVFILLPKAAVERLLRVFAKEIGSRGINVSCELPGPTVTDLFLTGNSEELIARIESANAYKR